MPAAQLTKLVSTTRRTCMPYRQTTVCRRLWPTLWTSLNHGSEAKEGRRELVVRRSRAWFNYFFLVVCRTREVLSVSCSNEISYGEYGRIALARERATWAR